MGKILALLGGWQGYAAAAGLAAILSIGATYYVVSMPYKLTIANMKAEEAKADAKNANDALAKFTADAERIHGAAEAFTGLQSKLDGQFGKISRNFQNAIKAKPLPVDCVPDAARMYSFANAIAAANSAAGFKPGPAVPATP